MKTKMPANLRKAAKAFVAQCPVLRVEETYAAVPVLNPDGAPKLRPSGKPQMELAMNGTRWAIYKMGGPGADLARRLGFSTSTVIFEGTAEQVIAEMAKGSAQVIEEYQGRHNA